MVNRTEIWRMDVAPDFGPVLLLAFPTAWTMMCAAKGQGKQEKDKTQLM